MAEKVAHISATFVKKPSIFELLAQDSLANTFYPALKHLVEYVVSKNAVRYSFLNRWFEEWYFGLNLLVQSHYLQHYDATFSERFYNLKRVHFNGYTHSSNLPAKQKILSLLFSVCFPYLWNKLKILAQNQYDFHTPIQISEKYRQFLIYFNKIVHLLLESISTLYYLNYMTGRSDTHSLFLQLAGVTLAYSFDNRTYNSSLRSIIKDVLSGNWRSSVILIGILRDFLGRSLELFAFFIQFLNWWHSDQANTKFFAYPIPPAPRNAFMNDENKKFESTCPICKEFLNIPTALPISGYVFCYNCIRKHVAQYRRCPITKLPARENDLVRIYTTPSL